MSRAWGKGSTTRWRRIRAAVLRRDKHRCTINAPGCTGRATHADHIVLRSMGGDDSLDNLRAACESCNLGRARATPQPEPAPRRVTRW